WKGYCRGTVDDDSRICCARDNSSSPRDCENGWFLTKKWDDGVKLSNTTPVITLPPDTLKRIKLSNTAPVVTPPSDPLKEVLDANPSMCLGDKLVTKKSTWRCKGRKRGLPVSVVK
ncbi:hypothetical protein HN51_043663, partial [Arachis hypogaea]